MIHHILSAATAGHKAIEWTTPVKLKIRWPDFSTPTRQLTLPQPTDEPQEIAEAALRLFGQIWTDEQAVRLIGVGVSGLGTPPRQLSLWDIPPAPTPEQSARQQRVEAALAALQARFSPGIVRRGSELEQP
jgi:DNA polymerase-4